MPYAIASTAFCRRSRYTLPGASASMIAKIFRVIPSDHRDARCVTARIGAAEIRCTAPRYPSARRARHTVASPTPNSEARAAMVSPLA